MGDRGAKIGQICLYGVLLGGGVFMLQWLDYRLSVRAIAFEAAVGATGLVFLGLGVWFGLSWQRRAGLSADPAWPADRYGLTDRELTILELLANGATNKEIGRTLEITPNTVKTHVARILRKLGVENRTQAAMRFKAREGVA